MSSTVIVNRTALATSAPIPPPKPIGHHGVLVQAALAHKDVVNFAGVQVRNPTIASSSDDKNGELVVQGTIDLFGNKNVSADFDIWHGHPPPGVTVGSAARSIQRATVKGSLTLSQLIPSLGTASPGPDLIFQDISINHQNYLYDPTKSLGYNLDAKLVIDASFGPLSSILSKLFGIKDNILPIHADLGSNQSWGAPVNADALKIEGSFVGRTYPTTSGVQITSIGVRLILQRNPDKTVTRDVKVVGTLNLTPPGGSILPIALDYTLKDVGGKVQLTADLPAGVSWVNPMGAQGVVLNTAQFTSSLLLSADPWKDLKLNIAAQFQYKTTPINFTGSYAPGSTCSLRANIQSFDLASFYEALHHEPLRVPEVDVTFQSADLSIESGKGFSATLTNISIGGHGSGNATFIFSSAGSVIRADLGTVKFDEVTVNSAYILLDLQPTSSGKSSNATIHGDIKFEALEIAVAVHLYPSASTDGVKRTEWTVFAELSSSDNKLALSKLEPRLKGTAFDLALKDAVFIATSLNGPDVGIIIPDTYKPKKGIQVFATFDAIPVFNSLSKSNVTGMVLNASWSTTAGFSLNIFLPVERSLSLGKGITTTPIELSLDMIPSPIEKGEMTPALQVSGGIYIPVAHSPKPLLFKMTLTAVETNAIIAADLQGNWVDPFGISNEVTIGPELLLEAYLNYATGLSGVLFKGGFAIGKTSTTVTVSVNEDPLQELLSADVEKLNFTDVVAFAEKLFHAKFPPPPSDFLEFEQIKVYICPAELTINNVTYPRGYSFKSNMIVFGKHVGVACDVTDSVLSINGDVQDFQVGPLKVGGLDNKEQASLQVKVGKEIQKLLLDGAVTLYSETYGLHLEVNTQPSPQISFTIDFNFTELLTLKVNAALIGSPNFKDLSKADFTLNADLEQHILDHIHDEIFNLFTKAQKAVDENLDAAKERVRQEQIDLQKRITKAKDDLDASQKAWEGHEKIVREKNNKVIDDYNTKIKPFQDAITRAQKAFDAVVQNAQVKLTNAQHDSQVKIQAAMNDLENVKRKVESDIASAKQGVAGATAKMNHDFGSAENDIEAAKRKVESLQNQINNVANEINNIEHGSWWKKTAIPGLEIERGSLEAALKIAEGALDVAEAILKSTDYVTTKGALAAAQKILDMAQQAGPGLISEAEKALADAQALAQAAINKASEALKAIQNGPEKIAFDSAKDALAAYQRTADVLLEAANKAIAELAKCAEYVKYQTETTALAVAQAATKGLNAAEDMLAAAEQGSDEVLKLGKAIADAGIEAFNITSIHLSGSLGKSAGGAALKADIKGVALKKSFAISVDLNPTNVKNFFKDILQKLEEDMRKVLHA